MVKKKYFRVYKQLIMDTATISSLRLFNQQIAAPQFKTAKELVGWMGAMQAQDFPMSKWAVGLRLLHSTETEIEAAFNRGEILRTHLMRPTWHLVSPDDIYWMLELTAPQIKSLNKSRNRELELTETVLKKSREIIQLLLEGNRAMTREELGAHLNQAGIKTNENRLSHILMEAEISGLICSGPIRQKKHTHMLLEERVPKKQHLPKEESLALLARKYFASHSPATLPDFVWWSGLPVSDARKAVEMIKSEFISATIGSETYWFSEAVLQPNILPDSVYLLPAFDEYLISYKNRNAVIAADHHKKAISNNGIFRPTIVVNGQISGLWKRTFQKENVLVELDHFRPHDKGEVNLVVQAAEKYGNFMGRIIKLEIPSQSRLTRNH